MAINEEAKKKVSRIRSHKKIWYKIISPKIFGLREMGETYLSAPQVAVGRNLKINLKDLTGNIRDQNSYVAFKITSVSGSQLQTAVIGYELTTSFVKKLVRKNADRLDDCFVFFSKDGKRVVIKTLMITASKVYRSVGTALRKLIRESLQEEVSRNSFDSFMGLVASYKIQGSLKKALAKVYPLKELVLRTIILEGKAPTSPASEQAKEEAKEAAVREISGQSSGRPEQAEQPEISAAIETTAE